MDDVRDTNSALPYWLALNRLPNLGPKRFAALLEGLGPNIADWFNDRQPTQALRQCLQTLAISPVFDWAGVAQDLAWAEGASQTILTQQCARYPKALRMIPDAPLLLFVKGQPEWLALPQIAMVGTRHPSDAGANHAYEYAHALSLAGLTVTSGMALGIDGASHQGALAAGRGTVAVLGHGLDHCYPAAHQGLAAEIASSGALVSEYAMGVGPQRYHFPRRNRIISGLSGGVLVVEAAIRSGSLITAEMALEQGRQVFALPGSIDSPIAKGCHYLIRQGAELVESAETIVQALTPVYSGWHADNEASDCAYSMKD